MFSDVSNLTAVSVYSGNTLQWPPINNHSINLIIADVPEGHLVFSALPKFRTATSNTWTIVYCDDDCSPSDIEFHTSRLINTGGWHVVDTRLVDINAPQIL